MKISALIISILIMGALITGLYSFTSLLSEDINYDVDYDNTYKKSFEKTENISKKINESYTKMQNTFTSSNELAYIKLVPQAAILIKDTIIYPFTVIGEFFGSLSYHLGFPNWVNSLFFALIAVFFLFGIIALILRYRYT